jgi:hypothetical protein
MSTGEDLPVLSGALLSLCAVSCCSSCGIADVLDWFLIARLHGSVVRQRWGRAVARGTIFGSSSVSSHREDEELALIIRLENNCSAGISSSATSVVSRDAREK